MGDYDSGLEMRCHVCGAPIYADEKYCTMCGAEVAQMPRTVHTVLLSDLPPFEDGSTVPIDKVKCPVCGSTLYGDEQFCTFCGTKLGLSGQTPHVDKPVEWRDVRNDAHSVHGHEEEDADADYQPLMRPTLLRLTREEARNGCKKTTVVDGQHISVDVPPGASVETPVDIPGLGYRDERTGEVGPLRVCFRVV